MKGGYNGKVPQDAPFYYSLFVTPSKKAHFALDFGDYLSLVMLDTAHTEPIAGAQTEWLDKTLAARKGKQFLFVGYHYPA